MSTAKKLPAHGTRARYRLEIKKGPDGKAGTACDRCRAANSAAVRAARANRSASAARRGLHIVDEPAADTAAVTNSDTPRDTITENDSEPKPGPMVTAVTADLALIAIADQVPFHATLSALALQTAAEADDITASATSRAAARRQLFEVLRSLRTRKEGDGNSALDIVLEDFGLPLVPDRAAKARNAAGP